MCSFERKKKNRWKHFSLTVLHYESTKGVMMRWTVRRRQDGINDTDKWHSSQKPIVNNQIAKAKPTESMQVKWRSCTNTALRYGIPLTITSAEPNWINKVNLHQWNRAGRVFFTFFTFFLPPPSPSMDTRLLAEVLVGRWLNREPTSHVRLPLTNTTLGRAAQPKTCP